MRLVRANWNRSIPPRVTHTTPPLFATHPIKASDVVAGFSFSFGDTWLLLCAGTVSVRSASTSIGRSSTWRLPKGAVAYGPLRYPALGAPRSRADATRRQAHSHIWGRVPNVELLLFGLPLARSALLVISSTSFWYSLFNLPHLTRLRRLFPSESLSSMVRTVLPQELWSEFLADFIANVIREPVTLAGNSIGGYCCSTVAADFPHLVRGLVLLNSAGRILPGYSLPPPSSLPQKTLGDSLPGFVPWAVSRLLFAYLDGNVDTILRRCYPKHPEAIEAWLVDEIKRAAADPGSVDVFESVFYLPKPRPINFLIDRFGGPVLVVQGRFDPLNDAVRRADALRAACPEAVTVRLVDAGHCPMDELAGPVSAHIASFAKSPVDKQSSEDDEARPSTLAEEEAGGVADVVVELAGQSRPKLF